MPNGMPHFNVPLNLPVHHFISKLVENANLHLGPFSETGAPIDIPPLPLEVEGFDEPWEPPNAFVVDGFEWPDEDDPPNLYDEEIISKAKFAMFVSDLHLSDSSDGDDFFYKHPAVWAAGPAARGPSKAKLLDTALRIAEGIANKLEHDGVELILLGDAFDILEVLGRQGAGFPSSIYHPPFRAVLRAFKSRNPNNKVIHILGNHDYQTPGTYISLMDGIGKTYKNTHLEVFGIHGHQFDKANHQPTSPGSFGSKIARLTSMVEIWRQQLWADLEFQSSRFYPLLPVDNIRPFTRLADFVNEVFPNPTGVPKALTKLAGVVANLQGDTDNSVVEAASQLLRTGQATDAGGGKISSGNAKYVVMGHTHFPIITGHFFNTGTWMPIYLQQPSPAGDIWIERHPFLLIYRGEAGSVETHYFMTDVQGYMDRDRASSERLRRAAFGSKAKTLNDADDTVKAIGQ